MSDWQPTIRQAPGIPSRAAMSRQEVREAAPGNIAEAAATLGSMAIPATRPLVALQAMLASGDAQAAGVPWGIGRQLKNLVAGGEVSESFAKSVAAALRSSKKTGHEFGVHSSDPKLFTSGAVDYVDIPNHIAGRRASEKPGTMFHTHPKYAAEAGNPEYNIAAPSIHDLKSASGGELIGAPSTRGEFTYSKSVSQDEGYPVYEDAENYLADLIKVAQRPVSQNWAKGVGLTDPFEQNLFFSKTGPLQYLNSLERQGLITTQHQSGKTKLGDRRVPTNKLLEQYRADVLRNIM